MKIVINTSYGAVSEETKRLRTDAKFIEDVKTGRFVGHCFKYYAETLKVIEIPDEVTDYHVVNYDGCEGVIYVVNGKLYYKGSEECSVILQ